MPVSYGETTNYQIRYHRDGSELSETDVFKHSSETIDDAINDRELDILQLARDIYASPSLSRAGIRLIDTPLEVNYTGIKDALFAYLTCRNLPTV